MGDRAGSADGATELTAPEAQLHLPSATRMELQEVPRPDLVDTGRLRLVDYPVHDSTSITVTTLPITFISHRLVTALPLRSGSAAKVLGAVYNRRGRLIRDTERAKAGSAWHSNPGRLAEDAPQLSNARQLTGRSFFLGHYSPGFGHVLLETLTRLWPDVSYGEYDHFILYPRRMAKTRAIEDKVWLRALLEPFGVSLDRAVLVRKPLRVEQLDVPTAPFIIKATADPRFLGVFDVIAQHADLRPTETAGSPTPARIYLSRSGLGSHRRSTNEPLIEELMRSRGFVVLRPEAMTIFEQVSVLRGADVVVGCDGSAMHMAVFARPGTKLMCIDSRIVPSQFLIDQARGLDAVHVLAVRDVVARLDSWTADLERVKFGLDLLLDPA